MKENEKIIKQNERVQNAKLKIFEKGLKSNMAGKLKSLCPIFEENEENDGFSKMFTFLY